MNNNSNTKSIIKENIIFNILKTLVSVISPIIMFTYVARVISVDGLGRVSFAKNVSSYFCLFASLGISYYGTREGARLVKNKNDFSKLFWELLIINTVTTIVAVISYLVFCTLTPKMSEYGELVTINLTAIILSGFSNEWVLSAIEKYKIISIRTMCIQLLCLVLMFVFIHSEADYWVYAILLIISGYGPTIVNLTYIKKHNLISKVDIHSLKIGNHLKPVFVLFAMLVSIDLYTMLDTTMLGFIKGDWAVGIYSAAIKVPRLVNSLIASVGTVLVPRLSAYYETDRSKFDKLISKAMTFVFLVTVPCSVGIFGLSDEIIRLFCGEAYSSGGITLKILSLIVLIIPISVLFNNQIFIPMRREILVLKSTCIGAIVNLISNSILIPIYAENGAAVGTILAEFVVMCVCLYHVKKELKLKGLLKAYTGKFLVGIIVIVPIILFKYVTDNYLLRIVLSICVCVPLFGLLSYKSIRTLLKGGNT